jgi:hypothetical protein
MRDHLLDLVSHTNGLGVINQVRIVGTDTETNFNGIAEDRSVVLEGGLITPVPEFAGTFGMPNLGKLNILLNLQEYKEDAKLSISRKSTGEPEQMNFENKVGDFKNSYRFMASELANEKIKPPKFKGVKWNVEFEPNASAIMRLKMQATANAEETTFQAKVEDGHLKFFFGDHSTHAGNFVFQHDVSGDIKRAWPWPVKTVIAILDLAGDKVMRISDEGAAQIIVNSGLAVYTYTIPAQSK